MLADALINLYVVGALIALLPAARGAYTVQATRYAPAKPDRYEYAAAMFLAVVLAAWWPLTVLLVARRLADRSAR